MLALPSTLYVGRHGWQAAATFWRVHVAHKSTAIYYNTRTVLGAPSTTIHCLGASPSDAITGLSILESSAKTQPVTERCPRRPPLPLALHIVGGRKDGVGAATAVTPIMSRGCTTNVTCAPSILRLRGVRVRPNSCGIHHRHAVAEPPPPSSSSHGGVHHPHRCGPRP